MVPKATACLLIALILISPSACCCTVDAVANWVLQGIFLETGIPQPSSCCRRVSDMSSSSDDAATCCQQERTAGVNGRHCATDDPHGNSHRCPCREDGSGRSGPSFTLNLTAATAAPVLNALQLPYVVSTISVINSPVVIARTYFSERPHGLCDDGQGILRAYGRLRI